MDGPAAGPAYTIVIVGTGPRGIATLERLAVHLRNESYGARVRICLVDSAEIGAGRIWRRGQPRWLMMNTVVGDLTIFSGARDGGACRPGAGCSFAEWLAATADPGLAALTCNDYAPRWAYGAYLHHAYSRIRASLQGVAEVREVRGHVLAVEVPDSHYRVTVCEQDRRLVIAADTVVLATGHSPSRLPAGAARLAHLGTQIPGLRYLAGDVVTELDLAAIPAGAGIGVLGLGLSFHDLALSLTVGRGGKFTESGDGTLTYRPSGNEPVIYAGSRSGMLIGTRGLNQKPARRTFEPHFLTPQALAARRATAVRDSGSPALSFTRDVLPLLLAEINYVYYTAHARRHGGESFARQLGAALVAHGAEAGGWGEVATGMGLSDIHPIELGPLARPFAGQRFARPEDFRTEFCKVTYSDIEEARLGNVDGPLKAALDVVRDAREMIRMAVEFSGLSAHSHREEFRGGYEPLILLLTTGPPPASTEQIMALVEAGVVRIVGPGTVVGFDAERGQYAVESRHVDGSRVWVPTLVDARVRPPSVRRNADPLFQQMLADGVISEFVNAGAGKDAAAGFPTGALRVTPAENRVVSAVGTVQPGMYALGIPVEGARWFTQVGNGRPGMTTLFEREADAVALSVVRRLFTASHRHQALANPRAAAVGLADHERRLG